MEVMGSLIFSWVPTALPMMFTEKEQEAPAERVAPVIWIVVPPAETLSPEIVPTVQVRVERPFGVAISSPPGSVSEKPTPAKELLFGLVKVKVSALTPGLALGPNPIDAGEKDLESVGLLGRGQPVTVMSSRRAVAVALLPLAADVIRNHVVLKPVVLAVPVAAGNQLPLFPLAVVTSAKFVPSELEYMYR